MSDDSADGLAFKETLSRIDHNQAQVRKLLAEALKFERERQIAPWQIMVSGMAAGAAVFGAGAAFWKVFGG